MRWRAERRREDGRGRRTEGRRLRAEGGGRRTEGGETADGDERRDGVRRAEGGACARPSGDIHYSRHPAQRSQAPYGGRCPPSVPAMRRACLARQGACACVRVCRATHVRAGLLCSRWRLVCPLQISRDAPPHIVKPVGAGEVDAALLPAPALLLRLGVGRARRSRRRRAVGQRRARRLGPWRAPPPWQSSTRRLRP